MWTWRPWLGCAQGQYRDRDLDPHEHLDKVVVVPDVWTIENGMLTPTMKLRRGQIEERYAPQVDGWYAQGGTIVWG